MTYENSNCRFWRVRSGFGAMLYRQGYDVTLIDGWEPQAKAVIQEGLHIDINGKIIILT